MTERTQLEAIVHDTLRTTVAANKRRCAINQGAREPVLCDGEHNWDAARNWCSSCGVTREELVYRPTTGK